MRKQEEHRQDSGHSRNYQAEEEPSFPIVIVSTTMDPPPRGGSGEGGSSSSRSDNIWSSQDTRKPDNPKRLDQETSSFYSDTNTSWYGGSNDAPPIGGQPPGGASSSSLDYSSHNRNSSLALAANAAYSANNPYNFQYAVGSGDTANDMQDLSSTMSQLHMGGGGGGGDGSIASKSVTSTSIPGMVGASSGSTLGGISGATSSSQLGTAAAYQYPVGSQWSSSSRYPQQAPQSQYPWTSRGFDMQQQQQKSYDTSEATAYYDDRSMSSAPPPGFASEGHGRDDRHGGDGGSIYSSSTYSQDQYRHPSRYQQDRYGSSHGGHGRYPGRGERRRQAPSGSDHYSQQQPMPHYHRPQQYSQSQRAGPRTSSLQAALDLDDRHSFDRGYLHEDDIDDDTHVADSARASSEAIRMLMHPPTSMTDSLTSSTGSALVANRLPLERLTTDDSRSLGTTGSTRGGDGGRYTATTAAARPILPAMEDMVFDNYSAHDDEEEDEEDESNYPWQTETSMDSALMGGSTQSKRRDWLLRMNRRLTDVPVGDLDPTVTPINAIMNAWAKTKSSQGASMVETWLNRAQEEYDAGNARVVVTNKMYTMAVDAWAKSGQGLVAAQRAESILQHMHQQYQTTGLETLKPTTGIFNAVINAWARSREKYAPERAEQILKWMNNLNRTNPSIRPDKYTFNTVIHAYAKAGGASAAKKAQELLTSMQTMYQLGNILAKPDTITVRLERNWNNLAAFILLRHSPISFDCLCYS
jgi:hypothetical protein